MVYTIVGDLACPYNLPSKYDAEVDLAMSHANSPALGDLHRFVVKRVGRLFRRSILSR